MSKQEVVEVADFNAANAYCQNLRAEIEEDVNNDPRAIGKIISPTEIENYDKSICGINLS